MRCKIRLYEKGIMSYDEVFLSFVSWSGHAKYSDSYVLVKEFFEMIG